MNNIFFRIYLFILVFMTQCIFAQDYPDGMSEGTLQVNSSSIPVKIYATTEIGDLNTFADKRTEGNTLVILNESNFEPGYFNYSAATMEKFGQAGYQFFDKDFRMVKLPVTKENAEKFKYAVKTSKPVAATDQVKLETPFKIWDPAKGIKLGPITLHFYSLMFIFAFGFGYLLMSRIFKIDNVNQKYLEPLFTWTLIGTILGARLGHVIFYQPELFKEDFWSVFLPISTKGGLKFTGFSGLASHGATIALIFTTLYYSFKIIKKNPFWVYDRLGIVVALGGAFVRMGNFFNSEIIGKPVDPNSPFALLFPQQSSEYGVTVPRYPSQLFEAFGYVCLFILLWILYRKTNKKYQQGWLFGLFFIILWAIRFFVEFLKMPQGDEFIQIGSLNTGQVLSIPFMIAGVIIMVISKKFTITQAENEKPD
ncbi:phosphatidylglycerol:prolipoprotein diacylglycerol transferase [Chryseobacterium sp. SORGH_AS909]|uniref:Phosphatidylglycerol--prolipoprotein diacylglyceryl transferase n=1 Tax=Chryseobacterium camelliae TaxID=1265445 RepID=A0ABU0TF12_9FLAO|nr:phosphatidylglycerol:prolipoprotein diacylglycerol transferase [Chryseobacterium camelliae]MDQ1099589.1 phosphatidylglycerol:prolipoprotein diacylglycerol transferase [Chryseobacterium sp. SORGH_AS_1048]MDR6086937.1 phosphatidylglycerol:prolipoprotein diacylglycerol transferase [Chryseobacterium sp. SORGH_AS_0909]MDR6131309.1 phosphatidylglycerol:prolipoprotein diacylglycerol transferase [Chryseobacterium sp. SORGH_AS_1175]MDT3406550.1 phosphatidylglycerol:prolipoprotein diacylglycerol trans